MKLKKWEIALLAALVVTILCGFTLAGDQQALSDKLIRLHVVANSDSGEDQALKIQVRNSVLNFVSEKLDGITDRAAAEKIIRTNIGSIAQHAQTTIQDAGYAYTVDVTLGRETFPTRNYDTFSLPAGEYTSLRIVIGDGGGRNWWCVLFPPLCVTASAESDFQDCGLEDSEISLITEETPEYKVKFKAVELIGQFRSWLGV